MNSCRKMERSLEGHTDKAQQFFHMSNSMPSIIKKVANAIQKQDQQFHFLDEFIEKKGFPLWNKSVVQTSGHHGAARIEGGAAYDSLVFVPLVMSHAEKVHGYLVCGIKDDSIKIRMIDGRAYSAFGFTKNWQGEPTAEFIATSTMYFSQRSFDNDGFVISDLRLFDSDSLSQSQRYVRLQIDSAGGRLGETIEVYEQQICVTSTTYPHLLAFKAAVGQNPEVVQICWTYEFWEDILNDTNPYYPVGTSGGGGDGWWNDNPCRVLPGDDPCGLGGGHNDTGWDPPLGLDEVYTIESIVDTSITDPCLKYVIDSILGVPGHKSQLNQLYTQFQTQPDAYKFLYKQDTTLQTLSGSPASGHTDVDTLTGGVLQITLTLNPKYLKDASREFVAAVIYHEIIHAYLKVKFPDLTFTDHHNIILQSYGRFTSNALNEVFPTSFSDQYEPRSLALQGIDDVILQLNPSTNNYEIISSQNAIALQVYSMGLFAARSTALEFFNGTKGTACP